MTTIPLFKPDPALAQLAQQIRAAILRHKLNNHMTKNILAAALVLASFPAAGDVFLDINGASKHSKDTYHYRGVTQEYNSRNAGLGLTVDLNKYFDLSGGFYDNSYNRLSVYGGVTIKHDLFYGDFRITPGVAVGVATGYRNTPVHASVLQPTLMATVRVTWRGVGFTAGYMPASNMAEGVNPVSVVTLQANVQILK